MVAPMGAWEDGFAAGWAAAHGVVANTASTRFILQEGEYQRKRASRGRSKAKRTRAPSAYNKRLGAAIRRINKRAKKKDGDYRKGWSRSKVFKMAHKEARRR